MPWCETCRRFYNPGSLSPDGTCVRCGRFIADPADDEAESTSIPWHFWLLVVALIVYLVWRLVDFVATVVT